MARKPNRPIQPKMPASKMKTFQISAPVSTHTRVVSCEVAECEQYARGWSMKLDLTTELGQKQAYYIKYHSGRSYRVVNQRDGLVDLEFRPGQPCFGEHRVRTELPEIYRVKGGDFRGNPLRTPVRTHSKPEHWVEEFAENQDRLKTLTERG